MLSERGQEFATIMHMFKRHMNQEHAHCTNSELMMLLMIHHMLEHHKEENLKEDGIQVSELAIWMKKSKPAVSKMLNQLEKKNYIIRTMSKKDRRAVCITITKEGGAALEEQTNKMDAFLNQVMNRMGDDADEFFVLLRKFEKILSEEENNFTW